MIIKKVIKSRLRVLYRSMQEHYLTFRILVILEEIGFLEKMFIIFADARKTREDVSNEMNKNLEFVLHNRDRIEKTKQLFFDEKSREVFEACFAYRAYRRPIPKKLYSENNQYLVKDIVNVTNNEVVIDGGAFIGDSIQQFINHARRKKIKNYSIIAFEPSIRNVSLIKKFYRKNPKIEVISKGLADKEKRVYFEESGSKSRIVYNGADNANYIETTYIDHVPQCKNATFIKMDIEGAEMDALRGAQNVIIQNKPKLAICIYHSNEDMIRIPQYIHELVPEYKLYVRHHSRGAIETVLYAAI